MAHTSEFEHKVGIVSGAASGIGRATALAFARAGAAVVVADLESSAEGAEETVRSIEQAGGRALFVPTDVSQAADVRRLVETTVSEYGQLDFAHNNAGISDFGFLHEIEEDQFDRVIAVDLKGVWLAMREQVRHMLDHGGGAIVNTASLAGLSGSPHLGAYIAAKHGVVGLTKQAGAELANLGIRVNAIAPAAIGTPMVLAADEDMQRYLMDPQAMHRLGTPEEVADAVLFLASDRASFITGTVLTVDGGATANAVSYDPSYNPGA